MAIFLESTPDAAVAEGHLFENRYGHFEPPSGEFVITNVLAPRPWANVMSNGRYGLAISQLGGGFSWLDNSQLGRITRWEQDLALDSYGRWIYIHDQGLDRVFSTTFAPVRQIALEEEVRIGLGYSVYRRRHAGFETSHTVFVPEGANAEHAIVEIRSLSSEPLHLVLGSYVEWFLGAQSEWHREFHRLFTSIDFEGDVLLAWKRTGLFEDCRQQPKESLTAYAAVAGLENVVWFGDKAQWIGPQGRLDRPAALVSGQEPENTGRWDDPIAAFRAPIVLGPGETVRFGFTIGAEDSRRDIDPPSLAEIESRLERTKLFHQRRCGELSIDTSDPALDLMSNSWLPYQAEVGRMKARCAYYQQGGAYGYRDQLQDSLMLLDTDPPATLRQIGRNAEAMYDDGGVRHWWHPDSPISAQSRHSDTCLWLAHAVLDYLDETADLSALERPFGFLSRESEGTDSEGSLLEHCQRGVARFLERRSHRGLPLIGSGDWNDGISHAGIEGKGESVWLAMFGFQTLNRLAKIYERTGQAKDAKSARWEARSLRKAVETHGWDGEWYIAGTSDDGRPFGSHECPAGKIFLNPQTWAAITGIGSPDRVHRALESVRSHLLKPYGALLLSPAYQEVDPNIGYITRYAPGLRENGGVYCHAGTWAVQAFAQCGDPATAYAVYKSMLPPLRAEADVDRYQAEPYVMPGNVDGPDSPHEGRAGWTWYTGSAAWMRRVGLHWLLGVRASFEGLIVDPKLAAELGPIRLQRPFRGDVFEIEIEAGGQHRLFVDGNETDFGPIPASGQNRRRTIRLATRR